MKDKPIFPQLASQPIPRPLTEREMEEMWHVVQHAIRKPPKKRLPVALMGVAASILFILALVILLTLPSSAPTVQKATVASATPAAATAATADAPPFIEEWEGAPDLMYEGTHETLKVAFIVDQSVKW